MDLFSRKISKTTEYSTEYYFERHGIRRVVCDLKGKRFADRYIIISDKKVYQLFGKRISEQLKKEGMFLNKLIIDPSRFPLSLEHLSFYVQQAIALEIGGGTGIIALGGKEVIHVSGFLASSLYNGLPLVLIPMTPGALSLSFSRSIKINHQEYPFLLNFPLCPRFVLFDVDVLRSLPSKGFRIIFDELILYSICSNRDFFQQLTVCIEKVGFDTDEIMLSDWTMIHELFQQYFVFQVELNQRSDDRVSLFVFPIYRAVSKYVKTQREAIFLSLKIMLEVSVCFGHLADDDFQKIQGVFDSLGISVKKIRCLVSDFLDSLFQGASSQEIPLILLSGIGRIHQHLGKSYTPVDRTSLKHVLLESGLFTNEEENVKDMSPNAFGLESISASQSSNYFPMPSQPVNIESVEDRYQADRNHHSIISHTPTSTVTNFSNPLCPDESETPLQKRLRLLRERRVNLQCGGLGKGGFLP